MLDQVYTPTAIGRTLYVDAVNGNDTTGRVYDSDRPFLTLAAAKAAAISGDWILVRPGTYTITAELTKTGVNWWFDAGTRVIWTEDEPTAAPMWGAGFYQVRGFASFERTINVHSSGPSATIIDISSLCQIDFDCLDLILADTSGHANAPITVRKTASGVLILKCRYVICTGSTGLGDAVYWSRGGVSIHAWAIQGQNRAIVTAATLSPIGDFYASANIISTFDSSSAATIYDESTNSSTAVWIHANHVNTTSVGDKSIYANGTARLYVTAQKLFGKVQADGTGLLYVRSDKLSPRNNADNLYAGGGASVTSWIKITDWDASTLTTDFMAVTAGTRHEFFSGRVRCASTANGVNISGGIAHLNQITIDTSANSSGNPVTVSGGTLILDDCTLLAEAARDSITAGSAQNVTVRGALSANRPVSVNITLITDANVIYPLPAFSADGGSSTFRTLSFSNANGISFSNNAGQVQASYTVPTVPAQFTGGFSTGGNTLGDTGLVTGRLVLAGGPNITLSGSTNAGSITISVSGGAGAAGNTGFISAGGATASLGTVVFADSNNVSFGVNGQTVTGSVPLLSVGLSTGGNTQGNTTVNTGQRFVLVGTNGITLSQATGAGSTTVSISGNAAQTTQPAINALGVSNTGNTAGNTGTSSGITFVVAGSNNITVSQSTAGGGPNTIWISGGAGGAGMSGGISNLGNTAGDTGTVTGRLVFVGTNNITLSGSTNGASETISIRGPDLIAAGMSTAGNTSGDTGFVTGQFALVGGNLITLSGSTNGGSITLTVSGANGLSAGFSTNGNTAGDTGLVSNRLVIVGSNNITLSGSTNAGSMSLSIIGAAGGAGYTAGLSNIGNTAGDTGAVTGRLILAGGNNITLSGSTNGGSMTVTVSAGAGGGFSAGASNLGNTAGDTGVTGTRLVMVGTGVVSLSQTTGAAGATLSVAVPATSSLSATGVVSISTNGSTISIGVPRQTIDFFDNAGIGVFSNTNYGDATMRVFPLTPINEVMPGDISISTLMLNVTQSVSTAATWTNRVSFGVYSSVNSTQLTRVWTGSTTWGTNAGNMNINDSFGGNRWLSMHSSLFDVAPELSSGVRYWGALWHRTSNNAGSMTLSFWGQQTLGNSGVRSGVMGAGSQSNTTLGWKRFNGIYSVSFTTAMPDAIAASDINKSVAAALNLPHVIFNNIGSNIV